MEREKDIRRGGNRNSIDKTDRIDHRANKREAESDPVHAIIVSGVKRRGSRNGKLFTLRFIHRFSSIMTPSEGRGSR